jgi:hypothetical protein
LDIKIASSSRDLNTKEPSAFSGSCGQGRTRDSGGSNRRWLRRPRVEARQGIRRGDRGDKDGVLTDVGEVLGGPESERMHGVSGAARSTWATVLRRLNRDGNRQNGFGSARGCLWQSRLALSASTSSESTQRTTGGGARPYLHGWRCCRGPPVTGRGSPDASQRREALRVTCFPRRYPCPTNRARETNDDAWLGTPVWQWRRTQG